MLNVKKTLTKIMKMQKDIVSVGAFTSSSVSFSANESKSVATSVTVPTGYSLVGCVGVSTSSGEFWIQSFYKTTGVNSITVFIRNRSSSSQSTTVTVRALFVRTT